MANVITSRKSKPVNVRRVYERVREMVKRKDSKGRNTYSMAGLSNETQNQQHHEDIRRARKIDRPNNGFTPGRTMRRVGRIPVEAGRFLRQHVDPRDTKTLKAFIKGQDFHTVPKNSF